MTAAENADVKNPLPFPDYTFDKRDAFNRKPVAIKAISLLQSEIDVSPMVIDGDWGIGKTEFCMKMINEMAVDDSHHLIYVDAFKADHANEPLLLRSQSPPFAIRLKHYLKLLQATYYVKSLQT